jgi:NAD(P)-dependent dehydrogenase (short-subunit alcohol dehydrogenase family)
MSSSSSYSTLDLSGKVAIVTGATSGIGAATAKVFGSRGATVVVSGRRVKEGTAVVDAITAAGGKAVFIAADVAKEDDIIKLIKQTVNLYGRIDIAFNNAGTLDGSASAPHVTSNDAYDKQFDLNVRGLHWCMKYEVEQFLKQRAADGHDGPTKFNGAELVSPSTLYLSSHPYTIINNASVVGLKGNDQLYAYNATKFAVIGLTRSAALNYAKQGIRINAVCPGYTHSEMTSSFPPAMMAAATPIGRVAQSEEVAEAVAFLASTSASLITGVALPVDGGMLA